MTLKRDDIIGKKRPTPVLAITLPVFGAAFVRKLSAADGLKVQAACRKDDGNTTDWPGRVVVLMLCDENGNRIFTDADASTFNDDPSLKDATEAVIEAGMTFNALRDADYEAAKKNSETTQPAS